MLRAALGAKTAGDDGRMSLARLSLCQRRLVHLADVLKSLFRRAVIATRLVALLSIALPSVALAQTVVVGGKDFTEQLLMAEMTRQLLASKGFDAERRSGFDTTSLRKAQEAGLVDVYWEYTGTSLREFNKITEQLDAKQTYERVKKLDADKGLIWLRPSRVNNTYAFAMRQADASERGIATISELAAQVLNGERIVFASNPEFYERGDGLRPLEKAYGFAFGRDRVVRLDTDIIYQVLRDLRLVDVGLVFATDGRIAAYGLTVLKDDREFFPNYTMAPVIRKQVLEQHPSIAAHLERLASLLDNETMARLNSMVDVGKVRIADVASGFLRSNGLH
jgi:osmoprotectant transport system substrate-binding protein